MRSRCALSVVAVFVLIVTAGAQAPRDAHSAYNRARECYIKGDLDRAIAGFTRAIEISANLDFRNSERRRQGWQESHLANASSGSTAIIVIDPSILTTRLVSFQTFRRVMERSSDIPNISQKWDRLIPKPKRLLSSNP